MICSVVTCCCCGGSAHDKNEKNNFFRCPCCGHQWLPVNSELNLQHYAELSDRNAMPKAYLDRKLQERVTFLMSMIHKGMSILEVGCAEGDLGKHLKEKVDVYYTGVELSADAIAAEKVLDSVIRKPNVLLDENQFDLIISFHVLEHIAEPLMEIDNWKKMLKPNGCLVIEVPNQSGHPLVVFDQNTEHIHQFNTVSIMALMAHAGFKVTSLISGCFESPSYIDSIRVVADQNLSDEEKNGAMINRLLSVINGCFDMYGIGGDFFNYIHPLLNKLPVSCLFDRQQQQHGKVGRGFVVKPFDISENEGRPILITSIRFQEEIKRMLLTLGVPENKIFYLSDILMG